MGGFIFISRRERRGRRGIFWGCDFAQRISGDFIAPGHGVKPQLEKSPSALSAGDKSNPPIPQWRCWADAARRSGHGKNAYVPWPKRISQVAKRNAHYGRITVLASFLICSCVTLMLLLRQHFKVLTPTLITGHMRKSDWPHEGN